MTQFVELGPDGVLSAAGAQCVDALFVPLLRKGHDEPKTLITALAGLYVRGVGVEWAALFGAGRCRVELPTYAFQRQRYWLDAGTSSAVSVAGLGQQSPGHPLLGAVVELPDSDGCVLTGRLSLVTHPWLADHAVLGSVLLPGAAFVELAIRAGDEAGCTVLEELVIEAPLVLAGQAGAQLRVAVGTADETGRRAVSVYSRVEEAPWIRHATGVLATADPVVPGAELVAWPPEGAEPVDIDGVYDDLAVAGYRYGAVFQGLRAVWRRGGEIFAEVAVPEQQRAEAALFGLHPALLDAALHASGAGGPDAGTARLPFSWNGVRLHVSGATALRVRISPVGPDAVALSLADVTGTPVATIGSLLVVRSRRSSYE